LNLADDLTAGGARLEELPDKTLEGETQAKEPLTAVEAFIFRGEQRGG
jgi:hypothetical protein